MRAGESKYELKLKNVLQCYIVEYQWLTVLHCMLHAVTIARKSTKLLIVNGLLCYINDNDAAWEVSLCFETAAPGTLDTLTTIGHPRKTCDAIAGKS